MPMTIVATKVHGLLQGHQLAIVFADRMELQGTDRYPRQALGQAGQDLGLLVFYQ